MILKWWLQKYHSTWSEVDGDYRIEQRPYTNHGMVLPLPSHLLGPQNTACSASAVKPATTENICIWRAGCWWAGVAYTVKCNCFPKSEHPRFGMGSLFVTSPLCGSSWSRRYRSILEMVCFKRWNKHIVATHGYTTTFVNILVLLFSNSTPSKWSLQAAAIKQLHGIGTSYSGSGIK